MFDDRTFDIIYLEIKLRNDELERQHQLEKLGIRARYQDANRQTEWRPDELQEPIPQIQEPVRPI